MKYIYIVWNENKTEGYVTPFAEVAYEVRKSADSNCYDRNGNCAKLGQAFCNIYLEDDCSIQEVNVVD